MKKLLVVLSMLCHLEYSHAFGRNHEYIINVVNAKNEPRENIIVRTETVRGYNQNSASCTTNAQGSCSLKFSAFAPTNTIVIVALEDKVEGNTLSAITLPPVVNSFFKNDDSVNAKLIYDIDTIKAKKIEKLAKEKRQELNTRPNLSESSVSESAVSAQTIEGIGDFIIGMSIDDFLETPVIKGKHLREKAKTYESPKGGELLRITSDTKFDEYTYGVKNPSVGYSKIYSSDIEKYEFMTSLGIENSRGEDYYNISATFFKGQLIFVGVDDRLRKFMEILTEKYGKPVVENNSKMEICQNGYGAKTEHLDGSIDYYWGRGKTVEAKYYIGNSSCGKYPYTRYEVYSPREKAQVDAIQAKGIKSFDSENIKSKARGSKL